MKGERIQLDLGTPSFARICSALIPLWTAIGLIVLWQIASALIGVDLILPTPWQAIRSLCALLQTEAFWRALGATMGRACVSFAISFSLAVLAAVIGVYSRTAKRVFDSIFAFIRSVPTMSVILLLLLWLTPSGAPMAIAAIVVCPTMYTAFSVAAAPD
ncbi:MAG: ABC transporter permease, partial [Christensenellaceae bacterium]